MNNNATMSHRSSGIMQHIGAAAGARTEARDLEIAIVVACDSPLLARARIAVIQRGSEPNAGRGIPGQRQHLPRPAVDELVTESGIQRASESVDPCQQR